MSKSFPEYTGKVRSGHANTAADIEDLMKEELERNITDKITDGLYQLSAGVFPAKA